MKAKMRFYSHNFIIFIELIAPNEEIVKQGKLMIDWFRWLERDVIKDFDND